MFKLQPIEKQFIKIPMVKRDIKQWKVFCQLGEEEYLKTEFERALLLYHRALQERPNCATAKVGIRRCREALTTVLIEPMEKELLFRSDTAQSFNYRPLGSRNKKTTLVSASREYDVDSTSDSRQSSARTSASPTQRSMKSYSHMTSSYGRWAQSLLSSTSVIDPFDPTVEMQLDSNHVLILRSNRQYLRQTYSQLEKSHKLEGDQSIKDLLIDEMSFVRRRSYFWRRLIPLRTIPRLFKFTDPKRVTQREASAVHRLDPVAITTDLLQQALVAYQNQEYNKTIELSKSCLDSVDRISLIDIDYKDEIFGAIYSTIGSSYFELESTEEAIEWHVKDLDYAKKRHLQNAEARSLGNLARTYTKRGELLKAINMWEARAGFCSTAEDMAEVSHEVGYLYISLELPEPALRCGVTCYEAAERAGSEELQAQACVLIAQSEVAMSQLKRGIESYNQARFLYQKQGNDEMVEYLNEAISEILEFLEDTELLEKDKQKRSKTKDVVSETDQKKETDGNEWQDDNQHETETDENKESKPANRIETEPLLSSREKSKVSFKAAPEVYSEETHMKFGLNKLSPHEENDMTLKKSVVKQPQPAKPKPSKSVLQSKSYGNLGKAKKVKSDKPKRRQVSKSHVSFSRAVILSSKPRIQIQEDGESDSEVTPKKGGFLPPVDPHKALVSQTSSSVTKENEAPTTTLLSTSSVVSPQELTEPIISEEEEEKDQQKENPQSPPEDELLFSDTEDVNEDTKLANFSSSSFYLSTGKSSSSSRLRKRSLASMADSQSNTDPRNARTDSFVIE